MTSNQEWGKDLSAIGFEAADLVQRVRTLVRAARSLADDAPAELVGVANNARFNLDAAVALIEAGADALLSLDDERCIEELEALAKSVHEGTVVEAGPRFSRPGGTPDPADRWPR